MLCRKQSLSHFGHAPSLEELESSNLSWDFQRKLFNNFLCSPKERKQQKTSMLVSRSLSSLLCALKNDPAHTAMTGNAVPCQNSCGSSLFQCWLRLALYRAAVVPVTFSRQLSGCNTRNWVSGPRVHEFYSVDIVLFVSDAWSWLIEFPREDTWLVFIVPDATWLTQLFEHELVKRNAFLGYSSSGT